MRDKYSAIWVSHSTINTYLKCPRAYYLSSVFKDPATGHKLNIIQPPLALGQAVHNTLESLSLLPVESRFDDSLMGKFENAWESVSGKWGGFFDKEQEEEYKERGRAMITRVAENPGPLLNKAIKIKQNLPHYWLSEEDGIILCGKIDWLEYLPESDSVNILDFKTGKHEEDGDSLQLPIYYLLVTNLQKRKVGKASYWYINKDIEPKEVPLPDSFEAYDNVLAVARKMKLARTLENFKCPNGEEGCKHCKPYEAILKGEAEFVGTDEYKRDIYTIPYTPSKNANEPDPFTQVPDDEPF